MIFLTVVNYFRPCLKSTEPEDQVKISFRLEIFYPATDMYNENVTH